MKTKSIFFSLLFVIGLCIATPSIAQPEPYDVYLEVTNQHKTDILDFQVGFESSVISWRGDLPPQAVRGLSRSPMMKGLEVKFLMKDRLVCQIPFSEGRKAIAEANIIRSRGCRTSGIFLKYIENQVCTWEVFCKRP